MNGNNKSPSTADIPVNPLFGGDELPFQAVQSVSDIMYYLEEQTIETHSLMIANEVLSGRTEQTHGSTERTIMGQIHLFGLLRETLDQAADMHTKQIEQGVQEEMIKRRAEAALNVPDSNYTDRLMRVRWYHGPHKRQG